MEQLDRIRAKVTALQHAARAAEARGEKACFSFGDGVHRYVLGPPLDEGSVVAFEAWHGIHLPDGYRAFLLGVGNGGMGPGHLLLPLDPDDDELSERGFVGQPRMDGYLAAPFPGASDGEDDAPPDDAPPDWFPEAQGTLAIAEFGCATQACLALNGPDAGTVWEHDSPRIQPVPDRARSLPRVTFLDWYERWLDEALAAAAR